MRKNASGSPNTTRNRSCDATPSVPPKKNHASRFLREKGRSSTSSVASCANVKSAYVGFPNQSKRENAPAHASMAVPGVGDVVVSFSFTSAERMRSWATSWRPSEASKNQSQKLSRWARSQKM